MNNLATETATLSAECDCLGEYKLLVFVFAPVLVLFMIICAETVRMHYSFRRQTEKMLVQAHENLEWAYEKLERAHEKLEWAHRRMVDIDGNRTRISPPLQGLKL
ncbi:unnamed protein product [Cylicocyclus nassatus]|uniref:Transmembrane protein n=1 Tax=Cylicocyclus nassatus TaxID=53992 RepID=A0AA36GVR6_CYLNA|nr:unnamed protein product [Cylicocyclus nassatus]